MLSSWRRVQFHILWFAILRSRVSSVYWKDMMESITAQRGQCIDLPQVLSDYDQWILARTLKFYLVIVHPVQGSSVPQDRGLLNKIVKKGTVREFYEDE